MDYCCNKKSDNLPGKTFKVIACKVMAREFYYYAYTSKNCVDILLLEQQLHNTPDNLRKTLQSAIDSVENEAQQYDAILIGYGLCSNGIVGISSKKYPLVIPRAHDCTTLFLGSKQEYRRLFDESGGIYWYTPGWLETCIMPGPDRTAVQINSYTQLYGEENAGFLMETEQTWIKEYKHAYYIDLPALHREDYIEYTRRCAGALSWDCRIIEGNGRLFEQLLNGDWGQEFLVLSPGQSVCASYEESTIIKAE